MTIEGFVGFLITILCQYNFLRKTQWVCAVMLFKPKPNKNKLNVLYIVLIFLLRRRVPVNSQPIEDDDVDVARERRRVLRGDAVNDMLKIENLTKVKLYPLCEALIHLTKQFINQPLFYA